MCAVFCFYEDVIVCAYIIYKLHVYIGVSAKLNANSKFVLIYAKLHINQKQP